MLPILAFREASSDYAALKYGLDLPRLVSFHLVPCLTRIVIITILVYIIILVLKID